MRSARAAPSLPEYVPARTARSAGALALLAAVAASIPSLGAAAGTVERAQAFLSAHQLPNGEYVGANVTDMALAIGAVDSAAANEATLFALAQRRPGDNEATLARIVALAASPLADDLGSTAFRDTILASANGLVPEAGGADPLVLAWAARFAATRKGDTTLASAVIQRLAALQHADGGFAFADNDSDFSLTADVAVALAALRDSPGAAGVLSAAVAWLSSQWAVMPNLPAADLSLFLLAAGTLDALTTASVVGQLVSRQGPAGDFDGDVRSTALAIQALRTALPDLTLQPSLVIDRAPAVGTTYSVTLNVKNAGRMPSPATEIASTVIDSTTNLVVFSGSFPVPALAPGVTESVSLSLGVQATQGPRTLTAIVNRDLVFSEANVDNNIVVMGYRVAGPPDLVIQPGDIAYVPSPPMVNQALDVTVRVSNLGDAVARNVHVQLFQGSPSAGGVLVAEAFLNTVAPGVPRTLSGQVIPKTLDPIELVARVDPENAIAEANETNNTTTLVTLKPVQPADFIVDLRGLLTGPGGTVNQGDSFTLNYGIDAYVARWGDWYWYPQYWPFKQATAVLYRGAPGSLVEIDRRSLTALQIAYGPVPTFSFSTTGWADGTYQYTVVSDLFAEAPDTDRTNNTKTIAVTVQTGNLPELWVDAVAADPPSVAPGGQVTLHGTLRNTGRAVATSIPVQVWVDVAGVVSTITVPELAPGATFDLNQAVTASQAPGTYGFAFNVDPQLTIPESSKANNAGRGKFRVLGSDLEVVSISTSPDPIPVGQPANAILVLRNVGLTANPYLVAQIEQWNTDGTKRQLGSLNTTVYPAPGTTSTFTIPITTQTLVGQVDGHLILPYSGIQQTFPIHALNPDFSVTSAAIRFEPGTPSPGDVVTPQVVVNNAGTLAAPTSVRIYRGYRESNDLASSGSIDVPAAGSATFVGAPFPLQASPPYVVTVVLDEENAFAEPNENDNSAIRSVLKSDGEVIVAFDQTHEQLLSIGGTSGYPARGYPDWAQDLVERGYTVKSINPGAGGLTVSKLLGVDVVVNVLPMTNYSAAEVVVWQEFFKAGGGLFFMGDWELSTGTLPEWQASEEHFLTRVVGVDGAHASLGGSIFPTFLRGSPGYGLIVDHPITVGVESVTGNLMGGFTQLPAGASTLLATGGYTPPNMVVATAFEKERGRVVLLGDTQVLDSGESCLLNACVVPYSYAGNRRFGMQIIDWLVNGGPHDYMPDLAFVPSQIQIIPSLPVSGDPTTTATVTVRNVGGALAASSGAVLRLYDGDPATGVLLGEGSLQALAVEGERTFTFSWDTTRAAGDHVLTAVIDPENKAAEFDEANNVITLAVTVRASNDLRVDPSDIVPSRDGSHTLAVTVHNVGYSEVAAGTRLAVSAFTATGERTIAAASLGTVPARSAVTVALPWRDIDETQQHLVTVTADADALLVDPTRENNTTRATLRPPALEIASPLPGTLWGGVKDVAWSGSSDERTQLTYFVAIAPEGGPYTGLGNTTDLTLPIDTRGYSDGNYRVKVTASDGFLATVREVPVVISNSPQALRGFEAGAGAATLSVGAGNALTHIAIPVASRVSSATLATTPVKAVSVISPGPVNAASVGLFNVGDTVWFFSTESDSTNVTLGYRRSFDGGVTWSDRTNILTFGLVDLRATVVHNRFGFHVAYWAVGSYSGPQYIVSADGLSWSAPVSTALGELFGNDEGLVLVRQAGLATISQGSPDGSSWTPAHSIAGVVNKNGVRAMVASGSLHIVAWDSSSFRYHRAATGADTSLASAVSVPVTFETTGFVSDATLFASDGALVLAYSTSSSAGWGVWAQRCELARDCTRRDSWLPSPVFLGVGSGGVQVGQLRADLLAFVWYYGHAYWRVNGLEGGTRFGPASPFDVWNQQGGDQRWTFENDAVGLAGLGPNSTLQYDRSPGLTPMDLAIDVGAKGTPDQARPGMPGTSVQVPDFAASLNAHLAAHQADAVDGFIQVPVSVTSSGVGQTVFRNLEVRYEPWNQIAGFADPPLFSPGASPGILDTSLLSLLSSGPVAVMAPSGSVVRTMSTVAIGGRYVATFDGRDDSGAVLPSGPYGFGAPGLPAGGLEIDDIPPTAALDVTADDAFGGVAAVRGTATDRDYAGSPKNFSRYSLEYTTNGTTYASIATSTVPVSSGVLGSWNTVGLAAGAATLRLTVWDRAGNSSSATRSVRVSPDAPHAPVIQTPTTSGSPVDVLANVTTVSGTGDPGTTITVFVNGATVGTTPCDGRWSLLNVSLPDGISIVEATSTRGTITGPRSAAITVARYALDVAVEAPAHLPAGGTATATIRISRTSVQATPLTVQLSAIDSTGHSVSFTFTPAATTLGFASTGAASFTSDLATLRVNPGSYRIVADVVAGGLVPARGEASVTLDPSALVEAVVGTDRAIYDALQSVAATLRLANGGNVETGPLTASFAFTRPNGGVDTLPPVPIASIAPGDTATASVLYGAPPLPVGGYRLDVLVLDGLGGMAATARTTFEVQPANGAGALAGTIAVTPVEYMPGDVLSASFTVTNHAASGDVAVSVLLISQTTSAVIARADQVLSIPSGAAVSGTAALPTLVASDDLIALLIGNGRGLAGQAVRILPWSDTTPPVITIAGFADGEHRSGPVTPTVTITDESPFTSSVTLNGSSYTSGTEVAADGTYDLVASATDAFGNAAGPVHRTFVVDTTPPMVTLSGFDDGSYVIATVYPSYLVTDDNLDRVEASLDGIPFVEGMAASTEQLHTLVVRAWDKAGNSVERTGTFTIDRTPPQIVLGGFQEGTIAPGVVTPSYTVSDTNLASAEALLDGMAFTSGTSVSTEGPHVLVVNALDLAGNSSTAPGHFTIDNTPPRITITGVSDGQLSSSSPTPIVVFDDANLVSATVTLDSVAFTSGTTVSTEGDHVLVADARDAAGNASTATIRFAVDRTPPAIVISGVTEGGVYEGGVAPTVEISDAHLSTSSITLDGATYLSGTPIAEVGSHLLVASGQDAAGNNATVQVAFTLQESGVCPGPEPLGPRLSVYEDALLNCFEVLVAWGDHDLANHAIVHGGAASIAWTPSDWSVLKLGRAGLRSRYRGLEFWIHGGTAGGQVFSLAVDSGRDHVVSDIGIDVLLGGPVPAGTWTKVTMPFRMSSPADDLVIMFKASDGVLPPVYLDDVVLLSDTAGSCTGTRGQQCSDGNVCNGSELCDGVGTCVRGLPLALDDQNPCTLDTCDPVTGVHHTSVTVGYSCFVGGVCGAFGTCDATGTCEPTSSVEEVRIYDDVVGVCFDDAGTSTSYDPYQSAVVHDGAHAIRFEPIAWEQVVFQAEDLGASFDAVDFWMNGGPVGGQTIEVLVDDGVQQLYEGYLAEDVLGHPIAPGVWEQVHIPFRAASTPGWIRITYQAIETGGTMYLDDVRFVRSTP